MNDKLVFLNSKLSELSAVNQDLRPDIIQLTETFVNDKLAYMALTLTDDRLETGM